MWFCVYIDYERMCCRGGFVKTADGKTNSSGRGFYPGNPVKHGTGGSGNGDHRTNGLVPLKEPPILQPPLQPPPPPLPIPVNPYRSGNHHSRTLPRLNVDNLVSIAHQLGKNTKIHRLCTCSYEIILL